MTFTNAIRVTSGCLTAFVKTLRNAQSAVPTLLHSLPPRGRCLRLARRVPVRLQYRCLLYFQGVCTSLTKTSPMHLAAISLLWYNL
ncbi:hypothetical protein AcV5_004855 [Taiwanofungus camphoratus]|nr:hypothetical protein AcV5_004855 [Antrodia cinnamomea]